MNRVRTFFLEEAGECMDRIRAELGSDAPDPSQLHAAVRKLRGSAQVSRYGELADRAEALEGVLKDAAGTGSWDQALAAEVIETVHWLEDRLEAVHGGRIEQDERQPMTDEPMEGAGNGGEVVPIAELEYRGQAALERAKSLREPLEDAIVAGDPPGGILDELFDLIELGTE